jgi:hypothetical protein
MRSVSPGSVYHRPIEEVLGKSAAGTKRGKKSVEWEVAEQVTLVSIQGSFENLVRLMSVMDNESKLLDLAAFDLHPAPGAPDQLVLDLQIKTFDLHRKGQS